MNRIEQQHQGSIEMDGVELKITDKFKYLGSLITNTASIEQEISHRIQMGGNFFQAVRNLIWNKKVPIKCKKTLYQTYYLPILTYGSDTWPMRKKDTKRIQVAEMKFLRSIAGKTRRDRIRNENIRSMLGFESLEHRMSKSRLKWFGHLMRMNENKLPKIMYEKKVQGKRPRGRPRHRYKDTLKSDIEKRGFTLEVIERDQKYNNRLWWRGFVHRPVTTERNRFD